MQMKPWTDVQLNYADDLMHEYESFVFIAGILTTCLVAGYPKTFYSFVYKLELEMTIQD